jgi:sugar phosphate permease
MLSKLKSKWFHSGTVRPPFFYGWIIVLIAGLAHFSSGPGQTFVASMFMGPMLEEFGWSKTLFSAIYTTGSLTAAALMFLVGRLIDRFGVRIVLTFGGILLGGAALWMTTVNHPAKLYVGIVALRTFGQGTLPLASTTMVAMWFVRRRGRATAIASLGAGASQAVFPLLVYQLISHYGWRNAWAGLALVVWAVLLLPAMLFVRRTPESVGLLPDGESTPIADSNHQTYVPKRVESDFSLKEALRTRTLWLLIAASMAMPLIMTGLTLHHISLMEGKGLSSAAAAAAFSMFGPMMLAGNFIAGLLCDKIENRFVMAAGQVVLIGTMLFTFVISQSWHAFVYMMLAGFSVGIINTTNAVIWPNYFGRSELGSIRGISTTATIAFSAMGALPFGFVFDMTGSYDKAILILLVLPVICAAAVLFAVRPVKKG